MGWWEKLWTDPVATFTGALFVATAALIITGLLQWLETRTVAKRQLRAYLGATPQNVRFIGQGHIQALVDVTNTGSTPARDVRQWTAMEIRTPEDNARFQEMPQAGYGKRPIVPGATWTLGIEQQLTEEQLAGLQTRATVLFVWGRVEYRDIFGDRHWLTFRFQNIGTVFSTDAQGHRQFLGWSLFPEPDGNEGS